VLNQDAYLKKDALSQLVKAMEGNKACGICTPVSIDQKGSVNWCGGLDAYPTGRHRIAPLDQLGVDPIESAWANGACMLLRVDMVREIGLLDENFKFICSDSDYSLTARARGWKILVAPRAIVEHSLSGSGSASNAWLDAIKLQDQLYFAEKWLSGDVYKRLAVEGPKLTRMTIADEMRLTRAALGKLVDK